MKFKFLRQLTIQKNVSSHYTEKRLQTCNSQPNNLDIVALNKLNFLVTLDLQNSYKDSTVSFYTHFTYFP